MRATSLLAKILGLKHLRVCGIDFEVEGMVIDIEPTARIPRCSGCERKVRGTYDTRRGRWWRHLDLAGMRVHLRGDVRRVSCPRCGVRVERLPWAAPGSWFTYEFEDHVGYLAQRTDQTTVVQLMRVAWETVGSIVQRVVDRHGPRDRLNDLTHIGIDELSYRRHHEYITVVIDHTTRRVVWARRGKNAATVAEFFAELGERCAHLEAVTIDMSKAYRKAVAEAVPHAQVVFDRFHVQRLAHDALDAVRRAEVREAADRGDPGTRRALKRTRWALHKNPWNLTSAESVKLSEVQRTNKRLYRAYLLKESLVATLDRRQVQVARRKLDEWLAWAARSRLAPFVKLAHTIRDHVDGILAYVASGLSNGRAEGLNGKIRTLTRRAFGFHSADSLIAMLMLCCTQLHLHPIHNYPVAD